MKTKQDCLTKIFSSLETRASRDASMNSPMIALRNVSKRFGFRTVLQGIDLDIKTGDRTLLLGNNGAGKTTLLNIICSLTSPSEGEIFFKGRNYREAGHQLRQATASIAHESRLYGDLTATENLKVFGNLHSLKNLFPQIEKSLKFMDLDHAKHIPVHTFSSGMIKRLAIAKLILCQPEFLILDEPYSGLDENSTQLLQEYLKKFHQEGGTILMVTHQYSFGLQLCDRVLVIRNRSIHHDVPASRISPGQCRLWLQQD